MRMKNARTVLIVVILGLSLVVTGCGRRPAARAITVESLLAEMVDLGNLAERPEPSFKQATATSYDRESHKGGRRAGSPTATSGSTCARRPATAARSTCWPI